MTSITKKSQKMANFDFGRTGCLIHHSFSDWIILDQERQKKLNKGSNKMRPVNLSCAYCYLCTPPGECCISLFLVLVSFIMLVWGPDSSSSLITLLNCWPRSQLPDTVLLKAASQRCLMPSFILFATERDTKYEGGR